MRQDMQPLMILYTNDIHSRFERMPHIAEAFRLFRDANPGIPTLTVDAGDHMDRSQPVTESSLELA